MSSVVFIGGGNMASAFIGGMIRAGQSAQSIYVLETSKDHRDYLSRQWGVTCFEQTSPLLRQAKIVLWAIKPQHFAAAAHAYRDHVQHALHISIMAGIRTSSIAVALKTQRVVRAMPNTPALIGQGISGLFADASVTTEERHQVDALLSCSGTTLWLHNECELDAVTALSGSGPAYVMYILEALVEAGQGIGLSAEQSLQLLLQTFKGATELVLQAQESPGQLRKKVTSQGGTTQAAVAILDQRDVKNTLIEAARAAHHRAQEIGDELSNTGASFNP